MLICLAKSHEIQTSDSHPSAGPVSSGSGTLGSAWPGSCIRPAPAHNLACRKSRNHDEMACQRTKLSADIDINRKADDVNSKSVSVMSRFVDMLMLSIVYFKATRTKKHNQPLPELFPCKVAEEKSYVAGQLPGLHGVHGLLVNAFVVALHVAGVLFFVLVLSRKKTQQCLSDVPQTPKVW